MNYIDFVQLVSRMRKEQKDYFANHSRKSLNQAKALERLVDTTCLQILNSLPQQAGLFTETRDGSRTA